MSDVFVILTFLVAVVGLLVSLANFLVPQHLKSAAWLHLKRLHRERKRDTILKRLAKERHLKEIGKFQWEPECCYRDCRAPSLPGLRMCPGHHFTEADREGQFERTDFENEMLERSNEITQWYSDFDVAFFLQRPLAEVRLMDRDEYKRWILYLHKRRLVPSRLVGRHPTQLGSLGPRWRWAQEDEAEPSN